MTDASEYHERTSHTPQSVREMDFRPDPENRPRPYKQYRDLPTRPLSDRMRAPTVPALAAITDSGPATEDGPDLDLDALTTLCYCAAGITQSVDHDGQTYRFRAASCTGALYHVELYLVCGDLADLSAGVYHFDPTTCSLSLLREGEYRGVLAEASDHPAVREAPVTAVTTSRWWGNAWKYRERAFRHAWWDSGTLVANLLATARALEVPASAVLGFADRPVADLLGVDPDREAPLELVPLGSGDEAPAPPEVEAIDPETVPTSPDPRDHPLIAEAWWAGTLEDGESASEWRAAGQPPIGRVDTGDPTGADGRTFELDPVGPDRASKRPLFHTIRRRTSCREFTHDSMSYRKLSTVLDRAIRPAALDVRGEGAPPLQFNDPYLLVNAVDGLPQGTYHYHPQRATLERIGDCDRETSTRLALEQEWAGDAAVSVYFLTDVDALRERLGDRGYRAAQFEAGLAVGRLYLATYAHRTLGGTALTFYDGEVAEHLQPRASDQTPTMLYVLGERDD